MVFLSVAPYAGAPWFSLRDKKRAAIVGRARASTTTAVPVPSSSNANICQHNLDTPIPRRGPRSTTTRDGFPTRFPFVFCCSFETNADHRLPVLTIRGHAVTDRWARSDDARIGYGRNAVTKTGTRRRAALEFPGRRGPPIWNRGGQGESLCCDKGVWHTER